MEGLLMVQHADIDHTGLTGVGDLPGHTGDTTDAHDASAVSFDATGLANTSATEVQTAIADLDGAIAGSGIAPTILDAKGDIIAASAADTAARLAVGANGAVLMAASGQSTGLRWTSGLYFSRRLMAIGPAAADETYNLNSSSYTSPVSTNFYHDWDAFPATHFQISCYGRSSESGQTTTFQLASVAVPATGYSASGNDLAVPFNSGAATVVSSGWVAVSGTPTGLTLMCLALKGSNTTVDFVGRWVDVAMKIA